jgi:hypothetical protein
MSSPFDYIRIDFETSLKIINNKFHDYLYDIVYFNKETQHIELYHKKNTTEINSKFYELLENGIGYMKDNYNSVKLLFNQNYLDNDTLDNNLYNWKSICSFHHHFILYDNINDAMKRRCERFNTVIDKYNGTTALFYVTKIVHCENIVDYMNEIIELKKTYDIQCFIIIIINCDNIEDSEYYNELDKCLFIIKKVEDYETQSTKYGSDNNLHHEINNYEKEYDIMLKYFAIDLIEKNEI